MINLVAKTCYFSMVRYLERLDIRKGIKTFVTVYIFKLLQEMIEFAERKSREVFKHISLI